MHILVTGCSSFLGRNIVRLLITKGVRVTGTYRRYSRVLEDLNNKDFNAERVDLSTPHEFRKLPRKLDGIIHIAGVSIGPDVSRDNLIACNVHGASNLLDYAIQTDVGRLVYASTLSVHGCIKEAVVDDATPIRNPDIYGASKLLAERMFANNATKIYGASVRLPGVLGPGAHRAWLPTVLRKMKAGNKISLYGLENRFNNAVYVDDIADLFLNILVSERCDFPAFPVGAADPMAVKDIIKKMSELTKSKSQITWEKEKKQSFTISSDFAKNNYGYSPKSTEEMIESYCERPD